MTALLLAVVLASLAGSLHCAGMCGGLVIFSTGGEAASGLRRILVHVAYSGGRLVTYSILGAASGAVGATLDRAGSFAGLQRAAALVAGLTMVVWGVAALLELRGIRLLPRAASWPLVRRAFAAAHGRAPVVKAAIVGLLTGLMPCGWLWAFLVTAAGTGSAVGGAAVMAAFWLGTVPILVATGLGAQLVAAPLRRRLPALTAALLVVLGLTAIAGRPSSAAAAPQPPASVPDAPSLPERAPCCGDKR